MNIRSQYVPDVLVFLRDHFGLRYWLADPEGKTIEIETRSIGATELRAALEQYSDAIKFRMHLDHQRSLAIFVGGPRNGYRHGKFGKDTTIAIHIARAKWAAYIIGDDNLRAWFRGYATSKQKARKLAFYGAITRP